MRITIIHNEQECFMTINSRTIALIDGTNLHKNVRRLGWNLDYRKFRRFLADRYRVELAMVFIGYVAENGPLYTNLRRWGYNPIFRPTCRSAAGQIKGNCDTDLAVWAVAGCFENRYGAAVLVSGDGDFTGLSSFLEARGKLKAIIAPSYACCSRLLRQTKIQFAVLEDLKEELEYLSNPKPWNSTPIRGPERPLCNPHIP